MPPNNAERTNYPKVFFHCYWGHGTYKWDQDIWDNRNTLAKVLDIAPYPKHQTLQKNHHPRNSHPSDSAYYDHPEYYRLVQTSERHSTCGRVIIFSPYVVEPDQHEVLISEGWTKIKPMYGNGAVTYMKIVSSIRKGATIMDVPEILRFNAE